MRQRLRQRICYVGSCEEGECSTCEELGLAECAGFCANLATSFRDCGGCGQACELGEACISGRCIPGDCRGPCGEPGALVCCSLGKGRGGACVDMARDPRNCGGCGIDCGPDGSCTAGECT